MTEELRDTADHPAENDSQNTDSTDEIETGNETTKGVSPKKQNAKWIPMDKIDFDDKTYQVRQNEDADTIERYAGVWKKDIGDQEIGKGTKSPFPEILLEEREDGKFRIVSGWHRALAARQAGLAKIYGKIVSGSHDELLKLAMSENDKNALSMSDGDLRYCIVKVQELHPEWNSVMVITFLGKGSPSYAAQIEKERREQGGDSPNGETILKRLGKDGKWYSVTKKPTKSAQAKKNAKRTATSSKPATKKAETEKKKPSLKSFWNFFRDKTDEGVSLFLDSCEEHFPPDFDKENMYKKLAKWLEQRINLSDYLNNNGTKNGEPTT